MKSNTLAFIKSATALSPMGACQAPKGGAANNMRADHVTRQAEYGETEGEQIGNGVITALSLINNLEINEEIHAGRRENIKSSTPAA